MSLFSLFSSSSKPTEIEKKLQSILQALEANQRATEKAVEVLGVVKDRLNSYTLTSQEIQLLVGELRACRHLLDERGQYKALDRIMGPVEKPGAS